MREEDFPSEDRMVVGTERNRRHRRPKVRLCAHRGFDAHGAKQRRKLVYLGKDARFDDCFTVDGND